MKFIAKYCCLIFCFYLLSASNIKLSVSNLNNLKTNDTNENKITKSLLEITNTNTIINSNSIRDSSFLFNKRKFKIIQVSSESIEGIEGYAYFHTDKISTTFNNKEEKTISFYE